MYIFLYTETGASVIESALQPVRDKLPITSIVGDDYSYTD